MLFITYFKPIWITVIGTRVEVEQFWTISIYTKVKIIILKSCFLFVKFVFKDLKVVLKNFSKVNVGQLFLSKSSIYVGWLDSKYVYGINLSHSNSAWYVNKFYLRGSLECVINCSYNNFAIGQFFDQFYDEQLLMDI